MNQSVLEFEEGFIELEEGWEIIQKEITKLINVHEAAPESPPTDVNSCMTVFNTVYSLCIQKPPHDCSKQLYERYQDVYVDYLQSKVLPAIQEKHGVFLLQEVVKRWASYKLMVTKLCCYFFHLHRRFPAAKDVGFSCFYNILSEQMNVRVKDAVIALINHEREGGNIDQALVKNVLQIYVDLANKHVTQNVKENKKNSRAVAPIPQATSPFLEYYVSDFETAFLNDTADYYTQKASGWTKEDYASKAEECLQKEKDRVTHYLHSSTEEKLLKRVQDVLKQWLEKEHS